MTNQSPKPLSRMKPARDKISNKATNETAPGHMQEPNSSQGHGVETDTAVVPDSKEGGMMGEG